MNTVQICSSTFSVNTPNTFKSITFTTNNKIISVNNTIVLSLTTTNSLFAPTYLRVNTSLPIAFSFIILNTNRPYKVTTTDGSVLLTNLTSGNINSNYPLTVGNFILTNPAYSSKSVLVTFSTQVLINGTYYSVDSSSVAIQSNPSNITQFNVSILNNTVNIPTTYVINFTTINNLPVTS
jgi:hypothetical protein